MDPRPSEKHWGQALQTLSTSFPGQCRASYGLKSIFLKASPPWSSHVRGLISASSQKQMGSGFSCSLNPYGVQEGGQTDWGSVGLSVMLLGSACAEDTRPSSMKLAAPSITLRRIGGMRFPHPQSREIQCQKSRKDKKYTVPWGEVKRFSSHLDIVIYKQP